MKEAKNSRFLRSLSVMIILLIVISAVLPKVNAATRDISSGNVEISSNGTYTITGSTNDYCLKVLDNVTATIILDNVSIDRSADAPSMSGAFDIQSKAKVTLYLKGTNNMTGAKYMAGIAMATDAELIIYQDKSGGSLNANGGSCAAGIGGPLYSSGGIVTINSGTVTAKGGGSTGGWAEYGAAGIGGGNYEGDGGVITINGGIVNAYGKDYGAGIGGGSLGYGGTITINGGIVNAYGGNSGAGIGSGNCGTDGNTNGGNISITGGNVTAIGGIYGGAGIGGGLGSDGGTVNISGGIVMASSNYGGSFFGAGIGGGEHGDGADVTITGIGTKVTAIGGGNVNDIGSGEKHSSGGTLSVQNGAQLTLSKNGTNATVTLGNCTVNGGGAGKYAKTYIPPLITADSSESVTQVAPKFLTTNNETGINVDVSNIALPFGTTLISPHISGIPTTAKGTTWELTLSVTDQNGRFNGKEYLSRFNFELTDTNHQPVTGAIGRVIFRIPLTAFVGNNPRILYYDEATNSFNYMQSVIQDGYLEFVTTHLGCFMICSDQVNSRPSIPETGSHLTLFTLIRFILSLPL